MKRKIITVVAVMIIADNLIKVYQIFADSGYSVWEKMAYMLLRLLMAVSIASLFLFKKASK